MKVLFIAPLPPPINGQSLVSQRLLEHLRTRHHVIEVNIRKNSLTDGLDSVARVREVLQTFREILRHRREADTVYLTVSESLAGNMKDLVICFLCGGLRRRMFIQLHGGSLRRLLFDRHKVIRWLNRIVLKDLGGAIISGPSHLHIFDGVVDPSKIYIAANYAPDNLFSSAERIATKFSSGQGIRILYIAHMTEKKGYRRLLEGYLAASVAVRDRVWIDFAGAFENIESERAFREKIDDIPNVRYHGVVTDQAKQALFEQAHVLGLPSLFLEGQPISILEAYAAGCVAIATAQPGILDVFTPDENGYALYEGSPVEIAGVLTRLVSEESRLPVMALRNRELAGERYRGDVAMERVSSIIEGHGRPATSSA
jgi:glycosyltransferase involved in cell wall biosynthesis